ncbi:ABC transporter substrate-binding protein [Microbispora amethystogenes]|uniref:Sugar ABC transporter substrate-binding protein n=1 Tax=Microbispora amethystogenes TaxID=1427754 RepID=A0ABQ4FE78_9ACTN|nr:sugar ABC transporter substrate-binding protein [Microbispora amethystogenes]GIH33125.1 sugar ABC transporter substrate-binding protein [Microbispora amethystogenes]
MRRITRLAAVATILPLALAGCGSGDDSGGGSGNAQAPEKTEISYWLWDSNQLPAYQACADAFHAANPEITVKISQFGWADYWTSLTTNLVSGNAPDVFTNHLNYYPEFAGKQQILPLDEFVAADGTKTDVYAPGLADLWVSADGKRYGLPKDFDTVAIFYNKKMLDDAGITEDQMKSLTWNPDDGGTYEKIIARLTVDKNGRRGDEPGFDKKNVKVYGLGLDENNGAGVGQQMWSMYALSTGWQFTDKNPWGTKFRYDDPRFQKTIAWWRGLIDKGYMPSLAIARSGTSVNDGFGAGKYALSTNGSWMINTYYGYDGVEVGTAPTPVGPSGKRATIYNGLADSIYAGTKHKDQAWRWVKYLASADCQKTVGDKAIVFPAIPEALTVAEEKFKAKGIDIGAFTVQIHENTTSLFPITDHASDIGAVMGPAIDAVLSFEAEPSSLTKANDEVNALFQ